ncbi:MAG: hypothetical protein ACXWT3_05135 [Methylococcaceae bacterium]
MRLPLAYISVILLWATTPLVIKWSSAGSAIWIKRINAKLPALSKVAGGLLVALPAYVITWGLIDGHWPISLSRTSQAAIIYLGVIATTIGFVLYYYCLPI